MLRITSIDDIAHQGMSEPFLCLAENGLSYFVKGRRSGRASQINEWLCANMAQALGLPIAPFSLLEVPLNLYNELDNKFKTIGSGAAFGSQSVLNVNILEERNIRNIDLETQKRICAFDWLICNMDRSTGNPNLLYDTYSNTITAIDHNLAFDSEFNSLRFLDTHIFANAFESILQDLVEQARMQDFLKPAYHAYYKAKQELPISWETINEERDISSNYNFSYAESKIERLYSNQLWSMK